MQQIIFHKADVLGHQTEAPGLWFDSCERPPPTRKRRLSLCILGGCLRKVRLYWFHFFYYRHRNYKKKKDQAVCLLLHLQAWFPSSLVLLIRCSCFFFGLALSSLYPHDRVFNPLKSRMYNTNWKRRANTLTNRTFLWLSHLQVSELSWEVRQL